MEIIYSISYSTYEKKTLFEYNKIIGRTNVTLSDPLGQIDQAGYLVTKYTSPRVVEGINAIIDSENLEKPPLMYWINVLEFDRIKNRSISREEIKTKLVKSVIKPNVTVVIN